jgi:AAA15 family ATPase/GTPase
MNYGSYSIDYEYESSGLRNLMEMFSCLEQASRGGIAFIDEMDANMNEVYLKKLCEFFVNYGEGQLCFTTHNSVPMNILKKQKYGIDFINNEKQSVQWIRNGNYSPSKLYSEGMIPGLPFNIEDFDFLSVFFSEEK